MHNFTTILADTSSVFTPGAANVAVSVPPTYEHDMLMQKSTGMFEWAIWDENLPTASDAVTANLGAAYSVVNIYDPTLNSSPIATYANVSSVPLTLSDHAMIVEFH
jgi:hypothetical protein